MKVTQFFVEILKYVYRFSETSKIKKMESDYSLEYIFLSECANEMEMQWRIQGE
jgi:hypothetical protein